MARVCKYQSASYNKKWHWINRRHGVESPRVSGSGWNKLLLGGTSEMNGRTPTLRMMHAPLFLACSTCNQAKDRLPFPIGYTAVRKYCGHDFRLHILEGDRGPKFEVHLRHRFQKWGDSHVHYRSHLFIKRHRCACQIASHWTTWMWCRGRKEIVSHHDDIKSMCHI